MIDNDQPYILSIEKPVDPIGQLATLKTFQYMLSKNVFGIYDYHQNSFNMSEISKYITFKQI